MKKNTYKGKRIQMLGGVVVDDSGEELGFLDKNGLEVYIPDCTVEPTVLNWTIKGDLVEAVHSFHPPVEENCDIYGCCQDCPDMDCLGKEYC